MLARESFGKLGGMKTPQLQRRSVRSLVFVPLLLWMLVMSLAPEGRAAPSQLIVPTADSVLNIAVPVPAELGEGAGRWQLVEAGETQRVSVDVAPAVQPDGTPSRSQRVVLASIKPRAGGKDHRPFRLVESEAGERAVGPSFRWAERDEKTLGLWEGNRPVLGYNHGMRSKAGVPADRARSTYLHPIYGLDGEVLTDDFPEDHYHHRGLFWAWPHVRIGGANYSTWDLRGIEQRFERWLHRQAGNAAAVLAVENGWYIGERKAVQERVWLRVYPAQGDSQAIDVDLTWIPMGEPVTLEGAADKSYGGFTLRFAPRTETVITTPLGNKAEDLAVTRLPWADLSARFQGASGPSGAAVFISPEHPDYPPTWLTRHYGVLCVGWPGVKSATFLPGEQIRCQYRVWIHRGLAGADQLGAAYSAYQAAGKVRWE